MEIRPVVILTAFAAARLLRAEPNGSDAEPVIRNYPLNPGIAYAVRIATDEPTTCVFPGALTSLEAAGISSKADDHPPVLIAYEPGAAFFSVRALKPGARAAVNAMYQGCVFVLNFSAGSSPDRVITFTDEAVFRGVAYQRPGPETLARLIAWAKRVPLIAEQHPALAQEIGHAAPNSVSIFKNFTVTTEDVYRFDPEDCLVFRLGFRSLSGAEEHYDPAGLAIRAGNTLYRAGFAEADGTIPAHGVAEAFLAIAGAPDRDRANLSVKNVFSVVAPRPA